MIDYNFPPAIEPFIKMYEVGLLTHKHPLWHRINKILISADDICSYSHTLEEMEEDFELDNEGLWVLRRQLETEQNTLDALISDLLADIPTEDT